MKALCCNVVQINNVQQLSCSSECLEGNRENISKSMHIYTVIITITMHAYAIALYSKRYISEMAALICMCDAPLESMLCGLNEASLFIGDAISTRRMRLTAIAAPLVCFGRTAILKPTETDAYYAMKLPIYSSILLVKLKCTMVHSKELHIN